MLFIIEPLIVRVICKCGLPTEEDGNLNSEPDEEHIEVATEGEQGLGAMIGFANALILLTIGISAIGGIGLLVWWIVRHGR